jgi:hypothetical protein
MTALAQAMVEYAEELDEVTPGSGLTYLKTVRAAALAKIAAGGGNEFIGSTVNGQTFSSQITLAANDMFEAMSEAIRNYRGETIRITYATVSGVPH